MTRLFIHEVRPVDVPEDERMFLRSPEKGRGFVNPWGVQVRKGVQDLIRWRVATNPFSAEKRGPWDPPRVSNARRESDALGAGARVTWMGHASVLIEIDGVVVLVDPIFGNTGPYRRAAPAPFSPDQLPHVDLVVLTHGHYDHLDTRSLRAIAGLFSDAVFVAPLGLGRFLPKACRNKIELGWWQGMTLRGVQVCLVPAQHWHMRVGVDVDRALWAGVVVKGSRSVYHTGDTGYFGGFKTIGRAFPDLDVAVMPMGAYEPRWFMGDQHMAPEHSLQGFREVGARFLVPMHWGTFDLSDEPLWHGAQTLLPRLAREQGLDPERVRVLAHGGTLAFGDRPDVVGWVREER